MFSLKEKRILITGASSGIGSAIAMMAASAGATVTLLGRSAERLGALQEKLSGSGHVSRAFDLVNTDDLSNFVSTGTSYDGVVFNAGIIEYLPVKFAGIEKIKKIFDTNFYATVSLNQQLLKSKRINKDGSLVFISSISSGLGVPGTALYAASKAAVSAYARVVASELSLLGIRANCISPGIVETAMKESIEDAVGEMDHDKKKYPLGYGKPEDIASLANYLLSNASNWMTGSDIRIDGGYSLQ